ncbi:MAG: phosphate ABC transporter substrate-binding protein [Planctomycetota bacterium]
MGFMGKLICAVALAVVTTGAFAQAEDKLILDGSTTVGPIAKAFAEYYMKQNPGVEVSVSESGSGNGAKSIINGACDIGCMSRFMKEKEFKAAAEKGVHPVPYAIAMDGIAPVVHPSNPIAEITVDQLKKIYKGEIKKWSELGGPDKPIVVISRDTNSGTYETWEKLVMSKEKIVGSAEYATSNGAVRARVQNTPYAIGYVGVGFIDKTVKALPVDGIKPSVKAVTSGAYPIARNLYMMTAGEPKLGSHTHRYISLYLTPEGQQIIEDIGYVPVTEYK